LDNLRVRQPNTFKCPPATKDLINPNIDDEDGNPLSGSNDPAANPTLRSGVAQAGALVYATEPILKSGTDGCFDGRNHLYFSDGDQWIPLANCLPSSTPSLQYGEFSISNNTAETDTKEETTWYGVTADEDIDIIRKGLCSSEFELTSGSQPALEYTGEKERLVKITASMTWTGSYTESDDDEISDARAIISVGNSPAGGTSGNLANTEQKASLDGHDRHNMPRNVTCSGLAILNKGHKINVKVNKVIAEDDATSILVSFLNLSVVTL